MAAKKVTQKAVLRITKDRARSLGILLAQWGDSNVGGDIVIELSRVTSRRVAYQISNNEKHPRSVANGELDGRLVVKTA